ncbi:hypothetical protein ACFJGW_19095 [Burkholderiaceae bacterium UC74_6]
MRYLSFDLTDSSDDVLTLDAMASTREAEHPAVMAEVDQVLAWAQAHFGGRQGPVEDGNAWDHELLVQQEAGQWITVTLTLSASPEFVDAFLPVFGEHEE